MTERIVEIPGCGSCHEITHDFPGGSDIIQVIPVSRKEDIYAPLVRVDAAHRQPVPLHHITTTAVGLIGFIIGLTVSYLI